MVAEDGTWDVAVAAEDGYRSVIDEDVCWDVVTEDGTEDGYRYGEWTDGGWT